MYLNEWIYCVSLKELWDESEWIWGKFYESLSNETNR